MATGERLVELAEFDELFRCRAITLPSPISAIAGACGRPRKSPAMAETAGIGVAPHNPIGPIAGVAALHFAVSTSKSCDPGGNGRAPCPGTLTSCRDRYGWSRATGRFRQRRGLGLRSIEGVRAPSLRAGSAAYHQRRPRRRHDRRLVAAWRRRGRGSITRAKKKRSRQSFALWAARLGLTRARSMALS